MGMKENQTGLAFGLLGFCQTMGAPFTGWLGERLPIKIVQQIGITCEIVALFLIGPSLMFGGLPDKIWIIFVGCGMLGFTASLMYVLVTPEIIDASGGDIKERWATELQ